MEAYRAEKDPTANDWKKIVDAEYESKDKTNKYCHKHSNRTTK